jgi:hypothetical protein
MCAIATNITEKPSKEKLFQQNVQVIQRQPKTHHQMAKNSVH